MRGQAAHVNRGSDGPAVELMRALRGAIKAIEGWRASGGEPGAEVIAAGAELVRCFSSPAPPQKAQRGRAGSKRVYDREFAWSFMLDITIRDPDGLSDNQRELVRRLGAAFETRDAPAPKLTWLKNVVSKFYKSVRANDAAMIEKFRQSPDLWPQFESEKRYLLHCKARDRAAAKWLSNTALQQQYSSINDYIGAMTDRRKT